MKNNVSLIYNFFLVLGDFLALVAAFAGAYILRVSLDHRPLVFPVNAKTYLTVFLVVLPFWILIFGLLGLYNASIYEKRFKELGRLFVGSFVGMLFVVFWNFLSTKPILPARLVPIYGFALAFVFLVIFRNLARLIKTLLFSYQKGLTNVLIVGNTELSNQLVASLSNSSRSGYRVVGLVRDHKPDSKKLAQIKTYPNFLSARKALKNKIHSIIQTELYADESKNQEILSYAQTNHMAYRFSPGNSELFVGNIEVELFRSSIPVIAVHQTALLGWGRFVKRLFDLIAGGLLLVIFSPVLLLTSLLILFTSGWPVFFRQTRLTRYDQKFRVFKLRTHYRKYSSESAEEAFAKMGSPELAKQYRVNGDFLPNDPRITRLGKVLRRFSLDELPQLFNVIKGDLSLVGPRALTIADFSEYQKRHAILSVKSGITGLAQVSGRKNINHAERRQLDVYYVQNWSFWLDLVILTKTLRAIVTGEGAK
ncbi:MAG TPA: sugar transferase [Candidatus Saccharimonadales bacterium]|nr:sugar transferase [Candidatus Saccharimonadales bacterium]